MPIFNPSSGGGGGGGADTDGYTTLLSIHTGDNPANLLDADDLTFDVDGYEHIIIDLLFQPYNDNWAGGTDQVALRMNGSTVGHNTAVQTNYGGDGSYSNANHLKLTNAVSNSIMAIHAEINLTDTFNSVRADANMGVVGGSVKKASIVGSWLPGTTPTKVETIAIRTPFDSVIGMGRNSYLVVKAR